MKVVREMATWEIAIIALTVVSTSVAKKCLVLKLINGLTNCCHTLLSQNIYFILVYSVT